MNTAYGALKHHFNKLLMGNQYNNGLEPIRDVYEKAFHIKINLFDIYQTQIHDRNNPIGAICTLLGPEPEMEDEKEIPTGILWEEQTSGLISVNTISDEILKGINDEETARWYINSVYKSMLDVVQYDRFYKSDAVARNNPYMIFVKCVPLYFTFHHVAECIPRMYDRDIFKDLIEKYTYASDTTELVISSLENSSYTEDITKIYSIITAEGKVKLLC